MTPRRGKVKTVSLDRLLVDHTYQRPYNEGGQKWVKARVKVYNPMLIGVLEVSEREDGSLYLLDGQHRRELLLLVGETSAQCNVHVGLTVQQEAHWFRHFNKHRRTIRAIEDWNAALAEGDKQTLEIKQIVESYGLTVAGYSSPATVASIWTLYNLHRTGGDDLLSRVLGLAQGAWGGLECASEGELLMAIGGLVSMFADKLDDKRAISQWEKDWTPRRLIGAAKEAKYLDRVSVRHAIAARLTKSYDQRLTAKNKLAPSASELEYEVA